MVAAHPRWSQIDNQLSYFESSVRLDVWDLDLRVVIYRKRVAHQTRKNFQLDLFSPDDGHYEYSAITTNKPELKGEFALDVVPTRQYGANSAWQQISVLAHNLMKSFQLDTMAPPKARSCKRTASYLLSLRLINATYSVRRAKTAVSSG